MIYLQTVGKIANPSPPFVSMCDNDDFVTSIDELGGNLIDMTLHAAGLRKEKVADHGNIVGHLGRSNELEGQRISIWVSQCIIRHFCI